MTEHCNGSEKTEDGGNNLTEHLVTIRNKWEHKGYWQAQFGGSQGILLAERGTVGPWETFKLVVIDGGELVSGTAVYLITMGDTHNNVPPHYVNARNGGGDFIYAQALTPDTSCRFQLIKVAGKPGNAIQNYDEVKISTHTGFGLCNEGWNKMISANQPKEQAHPFNILIHPF